MIGGHPVKFDCLYYNVRRRKWAYQDLSDIVDDLIPYCIPAMDDSDINNATIDEKRGRKLAFEDLRQANITAVKLLSWSISFDLAEKYQRYLNHPSLSSNEHLFNCTAPWFGNLCQYSFQNDTTMSFDSIVKALFMAKSNALISSELSIQLPCYTLLECNRGGDSICLDWREICDGVVHCLDDDIDEKGCFDMEVNECTENEYRCHNGLCIPSEFWENGMGDAHCLDGSDEPYALPYIYMCVEDPTFRCEEHSCRISSNNEFSCGDGQCVPYLTPCSNGRHISLIQAILAQNTLPNKCWIAMICLTEVGEQVNQDFCEILMSNESVSEFLDQCDTIYQFPSIPIYSNHVTFLYNKSRLLSNYTDGFLPDHVCYDAELCDLITSTFHHGNSTCISVQDIPLLTYEMELTFDSLIRDAGNYFSSCTISHAVLVDQTKYYNHPSLYQCKNSLKVISKRRLIDYRKDCFLMDDEEHQNSCSLDDPYRVKCIHQNICLSSILQGYSCDEEYDVYQIEKTMSFPKLCNRIKDTSFYYGYTETYLDELQCEYWPCDNMYTRCDGFWTCPDGQDEQNCGRTLCHPQIYQCISPYNYTLVCLPSARVHDNIDDCLGGSDELQHCRRSFPTGEDPRRFRCSTEERCLRTSELCDGTRQCEHGDDENFCKDYRLNCSTATIHNRSVIEIILCGLTESERNASSYFSIYTSSNYPPIQSNMDDQVLQELLEQEKSQNRPSSPVENNPWSWYCNRGLILNIAAPHNDTILKCLCPPSYYGDTCEFQNQRVSITLRLSSMNRRNTYAIVSMLIDDNDEKQEIEADDQFIYIVKESCSIDFNRYLLFPTLPKNLSKNYSVRVDAIEKNSMTYIGSWHFPIPFLFLPVNRISHALIIPPSPISFACVVTCYHGDCVRYVNKNNYFCRCLPGWSGIQCNQPTPRSTCSNISIHIGFSGNKSICVCPMNQLGIDCLLKFACPDKACENGGQCVSMDGSNVENKYACICPKEFFGSKCQYTKVRVDITLNDIDIPSYIIAYLFTLSNFSEPSQSMVIEKLSLFQRIITLRLSIPFHLLMIKIGKWYYLGVLQKQPKLFIETTVDPTHKCMPIGELFTATVMQMHRYQRVKLYHIPCQTRPHLKCFVDEAYICLCTNERHANCLNFDHGDTLQCSSDHSCVNEVQCVQDHLTCPSARICLCNNCFFGDQCQFYAKGFGSTLDQILGYDIRMNTALSRQPWSVKLCAILTMIIFVIGIPSGILSILTFLRKKSQEVGCGFYILVSSFTSLVAVIVFTMKFWFLLLSHQNDIGQQFFVTLNCLGIEPVLKIIVHIDNWLNACVAIERSVSVHQGISFNKSASKRIAKWIIVVVFAACIGLSIFPILHLKVVYDEKEERSWCVVPYAPWLHIYSSTIIFFHYFVPLLINIVSATFIVLATARQRMIAQKQGSYLSHLRHKLIMLKHLIISPTIIVVLTVPYIVIFVILDCNKASRLFWFHISGYFLTFLPAAFVFLIFTIPSPIYQQECRLMLSGLRRRFIRLKTNFISL